MGHKLRNRLMQFQIGFMNCLHNLMGHRRLFYAFKRMILDFSRRVRYCFNLFINLLWMIFQLMNVFGKRVYLNKFILNNIRLENWKKIDFIGFMKHFFKSRHQFFPESKKIFISVFYYLAGISFKRFFNHFFRLILFFFRNIEKRFFFFLKKK